MPFFLGRLRWTASHFHFNGRLLFRFLAHFLTTSWFIFLDFMLAFGDSIFPFSRLNFGSRIASIIPFNHETSHHLVKNLDLDLGSQKQEVGTLKWVCVHSPAVLIFRFVTLLCFIFDRCAISRECGIVRGLPPSCWFEPTSFNQPSMRRVLMVQRLEHRTEDREVPAVSGHPANLTQD